MNQIGFKNFRRFKELQPKDLGDITILVGANNAGKSTLVKGLLLILDNIKALKIGGGDSLQELKPEFRFDANEYHDLGIGTFKRALCNKRTKVEIGFCVRLQRDLDMMDDSGNRTKRKADFTITLYVTGNEDADETTGTISRIRVWDNTRGVKFDFNYDAGETVVEFASKKATTSEMKKNLEERVAMIQAELDSLYHESKMLKEEISDRQRMLRDYAEMEASVHQQMANLSMENARLAERMSRIQSNSPDALIEMQQLTEQMEQLRHEQLELQDRMAHEDSRHIKEDLSRLNSLSNSMLMRIAERNAELDKLRKSQEMLTKESPSRNQATKITLDINTVLDNSGVNYIVNQIESVISVSGMTEVLSDEDKANPVVYEKWQDKEADKAFIHERSGMLRDLSKDLSFVINGISAEYIYAHSVSQNIFYNTDNKNDYLAKSIHRFCRSKIVEGSTAHTFIKTWMKKFDIGDDFKIESFGGEAYRFYISDGGKWMDLADKGMGSNQMMILLINLASIIRKYEHTYAKPFIVIEEPEQNLHPDLQRMLTELLAYVNSNFRFKFIVETHSEYMIRRSQVLVAESGYKNEKDLEENCPFKVYYFPKEGDPYDMEYSITGRFGKPFGKNFYDASAQDSIALNKLEMASRNK